MTCSEICTILRNLRKISEKLCKNSILFNIIQYYSILIQYYSILFNRVLTREVREHRVPGRRRRGAHLRGVERRRLCAAAERRVLLGLLLRGRRPELKGSIGEGPNQSNFSDRSSVRIHSKFRNFR